MGPRIVFSWFLMYYDLSAWGYEGCIFEITPPPPIPFVLKFLDLILLASIASMWFGVFLGGGTRGELRTVSPHHIFLY